MSGNETPSGPRSPEEGTPSAFTLAAKHAPKVAGLAAAAAVLFAVAAGVVTNGAPVSVSIFVAVVVLVLGVVAALVAGVVGRSAARPGQAIAWSIVATFVTAIGLVLSSAFIGWPEQGALLVAKLMSAPELIRPDQNAAAPVIVKSDQPVGTLQPDVVLQEAPGDDPVAKVAALAKKPSLVLRNARLIMPNPGERRIISVSRLVLTDGGIVTNGGTLVIEALEIESNNGFITSFEHPDQPGQARDGTPGGRVTLVIHRRLSGMLTASLNGQAGRQGLDGLNGDRGNPGEQGESAASSAFDCSHGAGRGGNGKPGQPGRAGQTGGNGGDGGKLLLHATAQPSILDHIEFIANGGSPGAGGAGGQGGVGGPGGPGGSSTGWCKGDGPVGAVGPQGADGPTGETGRRGADGRLILN